MFSKRFFVTDIIRYVCNIYTILTNLIAQLSDINILEIHSLLSCFRRRSLFHRCYYNVTARHRLFYDRNNLARPIRIAIRSNAMVEEQIRVG